MQKPHGAVSAQLLAALAVSKHELGGFGCCRYISKAGEIASRVSGVPLVPAAAAFATAFAAITYAAPPQQLDAINGALVGLLLLLFTVRGVVDDQQLRSCSMRGDSGVGALP